MGRQDHSRENMYNKPGLGGAMIGGGITAIPGALLGGAVGGVLGCATLNPESGMKSGAFLGGALTAIPGVVVGGATELVVSVPIAGIKETANEWSATACLGANQRGDED